MEELGQEALPVDAGKNAPRRHLVQIIAELQQKGDLDTGPFMVLREIEHPSREP